jgi:hypothetical protein
MLALGLGLTVQSRTPACVLDLMYTPSPALGYRESDDATFCACHLNLGHLPCWRGVGAPVASPGACTLCDHLAYELACFARVDAVVTPGIPPLQVTGRGFLGRCMSTL